MVQVRVPYLVQDPQTAAAQDGGAVERLTFDEPFLLDGPVCRRVAVLDLDGDGGGGAPAARVLPGEGGGPCRYEIADEADFAARDFMHVNVFTTVLSTLRMFEEADALGREVRWAFDGPQLLVVPRAGERANALYERESRSLQLFHFPAAGGGQVFTALSQDVVAHETGHAILDGVAPDLYNAITPQSLALHEAMADLTALLVALRSRRLRERLLERTGGSLRGRNALSAMAEQFGFERERGRRSELRLLWNEKNLDPDDTTLDEHLETNRVTLADPHHLSLVLTGALYRVLARLHDHYTARRAAETGSSLVSASGFGLFRAREHFKRLLLRALDYLPPGEVTFADYGRAVLAADQASHPRDSLGRDELVRELVRRRVVDAPARLAVRTGFAAPEVAGLDLDALVAGDWAAYDFANRHRAFLGIPEGVHFRVRPRLDLAKAYYLGGGGPTTVREVVLKVSWDREEPNPPGMALPARRQITVGTTLALDRETGRVRALLRSEAAALPAGADAQAAQRDAMLGALVAAGRLHLARGGGDGGGPAERSGGAVRAEVSGELMRVRGSGRLLHAADDAAAGGEAGAAAGSVIPPASPLPPPGVDGSAFYALVERRGRGRGRFAAPPPHDTHTETPVPG